VLEQACPYLDIDGLDTLPGTRHLLGRQDDTLIACARSLAPDDIGNGAGVVEGATEARIGRVCVAATHRRGGLAGQLLGRLTDELDRRFAGVVQRLDAQLDAVPLYERAGFKRCGEPFLEDGIAHIVMRRAPRTAAVTGRP